MSQDELLARFTEAYEIATDPARWRGSLNGGKSSETFVYASVHAVLGRPGELEAIAPYWTGFITETPREERLAAVGYLLAMAENMPGLPAGLAFSPFVFQERDPQILSTAALYFCGLALPGEDGDVTGGAEMLIGVIQERIQNGESHEAGILAAGILLMGDLRFMPRMEQAWIALDDEGRSSMVKANSGFVTHAHVSFLLDRLEETEDPALFGAIAGNLARMGDMAAEMGVKSVERCVPVSSNPGNPIQLLEAWTGREYGAVIMPRLQSLSNAEDDDGAVMGMVMERWGGGVT